MRLKKLTTTRSPKPAVYSSLLTRRQILKAGLAVTGLGFGPDAALRAVSPFIASQSHFRA